MSAKEKIEKSGLEILTEQRKNEIRLHRKRINHANMTDTDLALHHALIYIQSPSLETLTWIRHYLRRI